MAKSIKSKSASSSTNPIEQTAVSKALGVETLPPTPVSTDITPPIDVGINAGIPSAFDIESLIIPTNYGEHFGVTKVITHVGIRRPNRTTFVRVKAGDMIQVFIYDDKNTGITYVLAPNIAEIIPEAARPVRLHRAVDRFGNQFLFPVNLPGEDGRRSLWHESLMQAISCAEQVWVRINSNMMAGAYDVQKAKGDLGEPVWSEHSMKQLVEIAFAGKVISSPNDVVVQQLLGAI